MLSNYNITFNTALFTIAKATASVTPNAASKTYGTADPTFTGTLTGFLAADGVTATYIRTAGETVAGSPYTISATLGPAGVLSNYNITSNTALFTISKANTTLVLQPTVGTGVETLTVSVSPGTSGVSTGNVTFTYLTTTLGMVTLTTPETAPAVAVLSTSNLAFGSDTVTATYNGDPNFNVISNTTTVTPDFSVGASLSTVTLAAGQSSPQITITLTSPTGFASQISLSCGSLPIYVHCLFSPGTIPATVPTNATSAISTLVVSVDSTNALEKQGRIELAAAAPLALLGLFSLLSGKRKRWMFYAGMVLLLAGVAGTLVGCTGAGSTTNLPPAGAQTIVVNATANGGIVHPLNLTVNITN